MLLLTAIVVIIYCLKNRKRNGDSFAPVAPVAQYSAYKPSPGPMAGPSDNRTSEYGYGNKAVQQTETVKVLALLVKVAPTVAFAEVTVNA